jgi:hypothetical protein
VPRDFTVCIEIENLDAPAALIDTRRIAIVVGWNHRNEGPPVGPTGNEYEHRITTVRRR